MSENNTVQDFLEEYRREEGILNDADKERIGESLNERLKEFFGPIRESEEHIREALVHDIKGLMMRLGGEVGDLKIDLDVKGGCLVGIDVSFGFEICDGSFRVESHVGKVDDVSILEDSKSE